MRAKREGEGGVARSSSARVRLRDEREDGDDRRGPPVSERTEREGEGWGAELGAWAASWPGERVVPTPRKKKKGKWLGLERDRRKC